MLTEGTTLTVGTHNVKVIRYLSEGGFSKIYEVTMDPAEGDSEIGCLKQVLVPDKNGLITLRKEVDVMKTLRKAKSIVKYYDSHAERLPDGSYQVLVLMELCPNKSLLEYMNDRIRSKLSEPEILKIMLDISIGVYEMHKIKLIHRDIKIENVLIDAKNNFKLCDFGSVSSPIRPPQHQQEFHLLGHDILYHTTPQYRSPEMIDLYRGFPIDERSDIWALGCFLYKLCYYTTPFEANGDIAILHASFQFPPAPVFSGDLKNLIIIMLQENPVYRPNIVQILILVAKLMGTEFKTLDLDDFYGAGEYNFQALHDMQREKHNQLLKQQQYYLEQQKQQQAYEQSKKHAISKNSSRASLQHLSRENSVHVKDAGTPVSSTKLDQDLQAKENPIPAADEQIYSSSNRNSGIVSVQPSVSTTSVPKEIPSDSSSEVDLDVDLPELDHIAERFPSLDAIDKTVSNDGADLRRSSSSYRARSSMETNGYESALESVVSRDFPPVDASKSRTDFESVDAWHKDGSQKVDVRAEKLADEIFSAGTGGHQRTKSGTSTKSEKDYRTSPLVVASNPKTPSSTAKGENEPESLVGSAQDTQMSGNSKSAAHIPFFQLPVSENGVAVGVSPPKGQKDPVSGLEARVGERLKQSAQFSPSAKPYEGLHLDHSRPEAKRGSSNPWGTSLTSPNSDPNKNQDIESHLQKHMSGLNLNSHLDDARKSSLEGDLIDLEGMSTPVPSLSRNESFLKPEPGEAGPPNLARSAVENSLIDMDFDGNNSKPKFKKRLSDMQPQPLHFQEQVIDFASDDENHSSEMNRVAIRNSLKKSRKHSDHKRNEAEGKKRLSFFGGSSD